MFYCSLACRFPPWCIASWSGWWWYKPRHKLFCSGFNGLSQICLRAIWCQFIILQNPILISHHFIGFGGSFELQNPTKSSQETIFVALNVVWYLARTFQIIGWMEIWIHASRSSEMLSLRPEQNGWHFEEKISLKQKLYFFICISLKFVSICPIGNRS